MLTGIVVQALSSVDELEAAERIAGAAVDAARPLGSALLTSVATFHRAIPLFYEGRLADALADLEQARVGIDEGWGGGLAWVASLKARALLELGDVAGARDALAIPPVPPESMDHSMLLFAQAQLALAERDHAAALENATEAGRHLDTGFGIDHPGLLPWRDAAALAAVALGQRAEGRRLAAAALERARWSGVPRAIARAMRTAAVLAGGRERIDLLAAAAEVLEGSPAALMRTHVLVELGAALRRDGHRSEARLPLRQALQMADAMGVVPLAEEARQELRATGARPRRAAFSGVDALTPAERRVAQLAARGLTSPQIAQELFVTTKTIQSHLASAYRKLDISSRLQLASALGEDAA
jgi:DNA-binding CsgD family transcriptional regulator